VAQVDPLRTIPEPGRRRDGEYHRSPPDWRNQLIYFLLPDRFSDEHELTDDNRLDRDDPQRAAPSDGPVKTWYWNHWAVSGRSRFQGGTLRGALDRLDYLEGLGVTALWIGSVCKQRIVGVDVNENLDGTDDGFFAPLKSDLNDADIDERPAQFRAAERSRDDYHGYAIQNFLDIDPRFGTAQDLKDLVDAAHQRDMYVILDIVINHSGENWTYGVPLTLNQLRPPFQEGRSDEERYPFGEWLDAANKPISGGIVPDLDSGVWPTEFQHPDAYSRRGSGNYGLGFLELSDSEFRVSDYRNRDLEYPLHRPSDGRRLTYRDQQLAPNLAAMIKLWSYWIAEFDLDGFRVDTFKHVPKWVAADFVTAVRDFAKSIGKSDFLMVGEVGGTDAQADTFLDIDGVHVLELGGRRNDLRELGAGNGSTVDRVLLPQPSKGWLDGLVERGKTTGNRQTEPDPDLSKRNFEAYQRPEFKTLIRDCVVTTIDDHDGLNLDRQTRIAGRYGEYAVVPAVAGLLFGPGVPCLYYGTEQALAGPQDAAQLLGGLGWIANGNRNDLDRCPGWGNQPQGGDRYLREAMFGPQHPRGAGASGLPGHPVDTALPGFGPAGTAGFHVFDRQAFWYRAIAAMAGARKRYPVLGVGDITRVRNGSVDGGGGMGDPLPAQLLAWTRHDANGNLAVVVLDVTPPMSPVSRKVSLLLPRSLFRGVRSLTQVVDISASGMTGPTDMAVNRPVSMRELPQSQAPYLDLGQIGNRAMRIYVGTMA
jgi:glycosidase